MSRILRRPMFRGGRVDSRGTGIASGLSYNNGGRVGFSNGGSNIMSRGGLGGPPKSPTPTPTGRLARAANWIKGIPSWMRASPIMGAGGLYGAGAGTGIMLGNIADWVTRAYDTPEAYAYRKQAVKDDPWAYHETDLEINEDGTMTSRGAMIDEKIKELDVGEKPGLFPRGGIGKWYKDRGLEKEYNISTGEKIVEEIANKDEKELTEQEKKYKELLEKYNSLESTLNELRNPTKSTEEEDLAEIEKKKKMFEKVYGSGRGEDATNMLLSFAGKALKPGADTKSAFGEFFEEESTRSSERKKYKDAAAQAAIQSFLAGETSYQKFKDELDLYKDKIAVQTAGAKAVEKNKSFATIRSESREQSNTKKNRDSAQKWLDNQGIPKFVNETNSKKVPTEELFVEENIGEYFIDQQTGEFFLIDTLENGEIGKIRKG